MGLLKGNAAYTEFKIQPREGRSESSIDVVSDITSFSTLFSEFAWTDTPGKNGVRRGWVSPLNPAHIQFETTSTLDRAFTLREDKVSVNATYKKICLQRAYDAWLDSHAGLTRVPKAVRSEIREDVEAHLLERALPSVSLVDFLVSGEKVYIFSTSAAQIELARAYFCECFDVNLVRADEDDETGRDFLLWLWMQHGKQGAPQIAAEDRLTLLSWGTGEKTIVVGEDPAESDDARRALLGKKRPSDFRCLITDADLEFKAAFVVEDHQVAVTKLGLPATVGSSDLTEKLDERASLFLSFVDTLATLREFAETAREDGAKWDDDVARWIQAQADALT